MISEVQNFIINIKKKTPFNFMKEGSHPKNSKFLVEFIYMYLNQSLSFSSKRSTLLLQVDSTSHQKPLVDFYQLIIDYILFQIFFEFSLLLYPVTSNTVKLPERVSGKSKVINVDSPNGFGVF